MITLGSIPKKPKRALAFGLGTVVGGLAGLLWQFRTNPSYTPQLGVEGDVIGLVLWGLVIAAVFATYSLLVRIVRKSADQASPSWAWFVGGLPFWFLLLPVHSFLRDGLGFPDQIWWLEMGVLCGTTFEVVRALCRRLQLDTSPSST